MAVNNINQLSAHKLLIYIAGQRIGTLTLDKSTNLPRLEYDSNWQQTGFPLSPALTLDNDHSRDAAFNYIDNALLEGEFRKLLAGHLCVSENDIYSQVRAIGNDLAGALSFRVVGQEPDTLQEASEAKFRVIEHAELIERLASREEISLLTWDHKPRLRVAGVQDKLSVFINEKGQFGFGNGGLCSTHIIKFEKYNCPNLVLNEYFCMKLSEAVGLPTAKVQFSRFEQYPALLVERFDRRYAPEQSKVFRSHVIDGCQALNLPRDYKYERNFGDGRDVKHIRDGASLPRLFELAKSMSSPVESLHWLINWQLFNLMISNYDSHGKNVSLFFDKSSSRFTPAYDLVNVAMFPQFKHVLAMGVGDEFDPEDINAYQLADFAETCEVSKKVLSHHLNNLADKVISILTQQSFIKTITQEPHFTEDDRHYMADVQAHILVRTRHLRSQASEIPNIEV